MANPNPSPATRFKKGQVANPAGRPKAKTLSELARQKLFGLDPNNPETTTLAEQIVDSWIASARAETMEAIKELLNRTEGKVPEKREHSGPNGAPIRVEFVNDWRSQQS
jgi:hypothetical protein